MTGYPFDDIYTFPNVPAGAAVYLRVPAPSHATLTKLIVTQSTGTASGFTADLYNSVLADPARSGSTDADGELPHYQENYRVVPTLTAANNVRVAASNGTPYPYVNQDYDPLGRGRYLVLKVNSVAAGTFTVSVAGFNASTA